jgi:hypothetical protein
MSLAWHAIHDSLLHSSRTLTFQRHFDLIRRNCSPLAPFRDPAALLDALHRQSGSPDEKNECLRALVREAQGTAPESDTALTVLLLALWPGLDSVRRRLLWRRIAAPADITSGILARATETLRGLDLGRVNRVAATVLQNVQRDMIRACCVEAELRRVTSSTFPEDLLELRVPGGGHLSASLLHADIERVIGDAAALVIRVAVEGFTQAQVAVEFGLSEEAARKRYQRASRRLREAHEKNV